MPNFKLQPEPGRIDHQAAVVPWPSVVELEVCVRCNRACTYCPNGTIGPTARQSQMDAQLYRQIINQLSEISYSGRLSFHFYNEPLLRKDLEDLVKAARVALPLAYFVLYTNGDLLDDIRYQRLLEAGIDYFLVTRHSREQLRPRLHQLVQFPEDLDLSGRSGAVRKVFTTLRRACFAPMEMLIVTVTGDVVLCHEDARREVILGNLRIESLQEVWRGEAMERIRRQLRQGGRQTASSPCSRCDHKGYPGPNQTI